MVTWGGIPLRLRYGYLPLDRRDANLVFQVIARGYEKGIRHHHQQQGIGFGTWCHGPYPRARDPSSTMAGASSLKSRLPRIHGDVAASIMCSRIPAASQVTSAVSPLRKAS